MDAWRADHSGPDVRADVEAEAAAARRLTLAGTPTIYVGGERYEGELSAVGLRSAIAVAATSG